MLCHAGFPLYEFLRTLGISGTTTGVRYLAADGYYASHSMDRIKHNKVMIALYLNGETIPERHGFPVRVLNPGYHGVKQTAWITEREVIDMTIKDYWEDRRWDCSPPMLVDSIIFFPEKGADVKLNTPLRISGAAFGGTRQRRNYSTDERSR